MKRIISQVKSCTPLSKLVASRLDAAGFHPFVADEAAALGMEGYALAVGGIRVQVPESEAAEATAFLEAEPA